MALEGCASGLRYPTITESNPNIQVYKGDRDCRIELLSFTLGSAEYEPEGAGFASWAQGQRATYAKTGPGNDKLSVYIESQLSAVLTTSETVIFSYTEAKKGTARNLNGAAVGNQQNLEVSGQPAPQFEISNLVFNGIVDSTGVGSFTFTVECQVAITTDGSNNYCGDLNMAAVRYQLIEDSFGGSMDLADAENLFDDNPGQTVGTISGNSFNATLQGPGRMVDHRELIFIISGSGSYRYYTIEISELTL